MGFKLRSGNGPLQFKQMGSSPVKQTTAPVHPDADKPYVKPDLTKKAENEAPKLTKEQMAQNKQDDKVTKKQREAYFEKELEAAKNTGEDRTNKQKANNKLELKKQKEIDKQLEKKEEIKLAGMSKDERKKHKADQKANNTEEGKGKNWLGRTGDKIKGAWGKYKEHVGYQEYYDTKASINELANQLRSSSYTRPQIATNKGKINRDKKLAADALALSNKEKEESKVKQEEQDAQKLKDQEVNNSYKHALTEESNARKLEIEKKLVGQTQDSVKNPDELDATQRFDEGQTDSYGNSLT